METFCQRYRVYEEKLCLHILVRGFRGDRRTHDQAAYRDHNLLGKFLYDVVDLGFCLCDLGVSEGRLCMKEPQVGVLCPEIRELDGDFGRS